MCWSLLCAYHHTSYSNYSSKNALFSFLPFQLKMFWFFFLKLKNSILSSTLNLKLLESHSASPIYPATSENSSHKESLDFTAVEAFQRKAADRLHSRVLQSTALTSKIWLDLKYREFCGEKILLQNSTALKVSTQSFAHTHTHTHPRTHPTERFFGEKLKRRKRLIWYTHNSPFDHPAVIITRGSWAGGDLCLISACFLLHFTLLPCHLDITCKHRFRISFQLPWGAGLLTDLYHHTFLKVSRALTHQPVSWTHTEDQSTPCTSHGGRNTPPTTLLCTIIDFPWVAASPWGFLLKLTRGKQQPSPQNYTACCVLMPKHTWAPTSLLQQSLTSSERGLCHPGILHLVSWNHLLHGRQSSMYHAAKVLN